MFVHRHIRLENNTKIFSQFIWRNNARIHVNIKFEIVTCFGLKRRYSVLFGLTDNFLESIEENISNERVNNRKKRI